MVEDTPREQGFELERLIHNELSLFGLHTRREQDIRSELCDTSFNGVDHWITKGNTHILVQDKWKETTSQPEVSQFLQCAKRIQKLAPNDTYHLVWVSKYNPTENSCKMLDEEKCYKVVLSDSIQKLARHAVLCIRDILEDFNGNKPENVLVSTVTQKPLAYEETLEGKQIIEQFSKKAREIQMMLYKFNYVCTDTASMQLREAYLPSTEEEWVRYTIIDYTKFLTKLSKCCIPKKSHPVDEHTYNNYIQARLMSTVLHPLVLDYNRLLEILKKQKVSDIETLPKIKCESNPMTDPEYRQAIKYVVNYTPYMDGWFYTKYQRKFW